MKRTVKRLKSTKAAIEDLKPLLSLDLPLTEATRRFQAAYIKKQLARARQHDRRCRASGAAPRQPLSKNAAALACPRASAEDRRAPQEGGEKENRHEESISEEESSQEDHEKEDRSQDGSKEIGDRETHAEVDEADNEKEGHQEDGQEENICRESGSQATVTHRAKLRGVTMVIKSLIADPGVRKRFFRDRVAAPTEWVVMIWASGLWSERSKARRSHRPNAVSSRLMLRA